MSIPLRTGGAQTTAGSQPWWSYDCTTPPQFTIRKHFDWNLETSSLLVF